MKPIARYCLCGASIRARSTPITTATVLVAAWQADHTGDGHGPATCSQANRARRREDRRAYAAAAAAKDPR